MLASTASSWRPDAWRRYPGRTIAQGRQGDQKTREVAMDPGGKLGGSNHRPGSLSRSHKRWRAARCCEHSFTRGLRSAYCRWAREQKGLGETNSLLKLDYSIEDSSKLLVWAGVITKPSSFQPPIQLPLTSVSIATAYFRQACLVRNDCPRLGVLPSREARVVARGRYKLDLVALWVLFYFGEADVELRSG